MNSSVLLYWKGDNLDLLVDLTCNEPTFQGELMATIDTNMRCLESISQHLDVADVQPEDIQTIQGE